MSVFVVFLFLFCSLLGCSQDKSTGNELEVEQPEEFKPFQRTGRIPNKDNRKPSPRKPKPSPTRPNPPQEQNPPPNDLSEDSGEEASEELSSEGSSAIRQKNGPDFEEDIDQYLDEERDDDFSIASKPGKTPNPGYSSYLTSMLQCVSIFPPDNFKENSAVRSAIEKIHRNQPIEEELIKQALEELGEGFELYGGSSPRKVIEALVEKGLLLLNDNYFSTFYFKDRGRFHRSSLTKHTHGCQKWVTKEDMDMLDVLVGTKRKGLIKPRKYITAELIYDEGGTIKDLTKEVEIPPKHIIGRTSKPLKYKLIGYISWNGGGYMDAYKRHGNQWFKCEAGGNPTVKSISEEELNREDPRDFGYIILEAIR